MFLGHFGLGFGAKKAAPEVSLCALFMAWQFADLLWPTLVLRGLEQWAAEAMWLLVVWADWIDRHRAPV